MYAKYLKRAFDAAVSLGALAVLSPVLLVLTVLGAVKMKGNPFFVQPRPGKNGRIFQLIKFRSMTCEKDSQGNLLPDEVRLTGYGKLLRATSLDELPELFNILKGDMSIVGPRPQLVRDMVFMTPEQRRRHSVMPGLTGLAQINGRNNITWEQKFEYDLAYIDSGITFWKDMKIILATVGKVFVQADTVREGTASDLDFGDWLMQQGKVDRAEYERKQEEAQALLRVLL
jgi:lipopolysaccharide/colanic/teichoic acid biosynthesis glycosyltransferase